MKVTYGFKDEGDGIPVNISVCPSTNPPLPEDLSVVPSYMHPYTYRHLHETLVVHRRVNGQVVTKMIPKSALHRLRGWACAYSVPYYPTETTPEMATARAKMKAIQDAIAESHASSSTDPKETA